MSGRRAKGEPKGERQWVAVYFARENWMSTYTCVAFVGAYNQILPCYLKHWCHPSPPGRSLPSHDEYGIVLPVKGQYFWKITFVPPAAVRCGGNAPTVAPWDPSGGVF